MSPFLALLWEFLCSRDTDNAHLALFRIAKVRPITGDPVAGWRF